MENNVVSQDILIEQNGKIMFAPYALGITSFALITLSILGLFLNASMISITSFFLSLIFSILGLVIFSIDKKNHNNLSNQDILKVKLSRILLILSLIISTVMLICGLGVVVYIGSYGFGR